MTQYTAPSKTGPQEQPRNEHPFRYDAALAELIETTWQRTWDAEQTFRAKGPGDEGFDPAQRKYFCLDMFPYPSGAGLHVGHPEGYIATDIVCRYKRHTGFNVLHPMGWDAFGLPAEQYAIQTNVHPAKTTRQSIETFRRQLKRFGFSYDWSREFATIDPEYYKWTQWIWLQAYNAWYDVVEDRARPISELVDELEQDHIHIDASGSLVRVERDAHKTDRNDAPKGHRLWQTLSVEEQRDVLNCRRLAYLDKQMVNWCPKLGTVLANEEVIDGRSERGGHQVVRKPLRQWMFRITAYAERLLRDLSTLDWPDSTRTMQSEWIGRSEGAEIQFRLAEVDQVPSWSGPIRVYTTRPDTIFGATYIVLAPEHPLVEAMLVRSVSSVNTISVEHYVLNSANKSDVDRMAVARQKTGVFTGVHAINPATNKPIPVWVADYVLMGYGHGAIMAVPAHDQRDFDFAQEFKLPIVDVVDNVALRAVRAFFNLATRTKLSDEDALHALVDFVSLCINQNRTDYETVWRTVSRRRGVPEGLDVDSAAEAIELEETRDEPATDVDGSLNPPSPERRGLISMIWQEVLEPLIDDDLPGLINAAEVYRLVERLGGAVEEAGVAVNSSNDDVSLNGLPTAQAKEKIIQWLERTHFGKHCVNYRLRDWLFSRQRYWGEPFPVVFDDDGQHYAIDESHLPVTLPDLEDFKPVESDEPQPLLAKATDWTHTTAKEAGVVSDALPEQSMVMRETNTMPNWAGSCWYYLRYCDPENDQRFVSREAERYWMLSSKNSAGAGHPIEPEDSFDREKHHLGGVDLYVGGAEHAVLHLLYARFWHKMLFDLGHVSTPEPFGRLFHQGMITSFAYQRADKSLVPADKVEERDGAFYEQGTDARLSRVIAKMSKSLKNVINPDDVIKDYGADTFRLYEMYMGPLDASKPWNTRDISGMFKFLQRVWRLVVDEQNGQLVVAETSNEDVERLLHRTIDKVAQDIERLAFNTAIAAMIEFVNTATTCGGLSKDQLLRFAVILSPFAPHMAEELWRKTGQGASIAYEPWPDVDQSLLTEDSIELPVQIMGKVRTRIVVPADADQKTIEEIALADARVQELLADKQIRKLIVVPAKIVNIIAS